MSAPTSTVGNIPVYTGPTPPAPKKALDMAAFLQLLTTELKNQDPTNPVSDSEYFAQIAQMGTVQGMNNMQASQHNVEATSLLGKTVSATVDPTSTGSGHVTGVVQYVVNKSGTPYLGVKDSTGTITEVPLSGVGAITN